MYRALVLTLTLACVCCGGSNDDASRARCTPAAGTTGSPMSVEEAVALINGLPHPVTTACLLEALDRPLRVELTSSMSSVQPAVGRRSPRIFIFSDPLVISVVPAGRGATVVEFSELGLDDMSVKAELPFPVTEPLSAGDAFAHIEVDATRTGCGVCHVREVFDRTVGSAKAYKSRGFRPVDDSLVALASLSAERSACDTSVEPERCAILAALLDHGTVREEHFLDPLPTQFEPAD